MSSSSVRPPPPAPLLGRSSSTSINPSTTTTTTTQHVDPAQLVTREDIERALSVLASDESRLDSLLASLVASSTTRLGDQLDRLAQLGPVVDGIGQESRHLADEIRRVAETAERVGAKVRGLDEEQVRQTPPLLSCAGGIL